MKKYCSKCKKEVIPSWTICNFCGNRLDNIEGFIISNEPPVEEVSFFKKLTSGDNKVAIVIKKIAIIEVICGIIVGLCSWAVSEEFYFFVIWLIATGIGAVFTYSWGEKIQILDDIRKK